jgi:hypothetical protein
MVESKVTHGDGGINYVTVFLELWRPNKVSRE